MLGADAPAYSLAVWHGFNAPLLMSVLALAGGVVLYLAAAPACSRAASTACRCCRRIDGRRVFERVLVDLSRRGARRLEASLGTRRLQPQLRWLVWLRGRRPLRPVAARAGSRLAERSAGRQPAGSACSRCCGSSGGACALGAAMQAKFHRLAALMLPAAPGWSPASRFVWFSAPDLALTQLLVEIVTTVLLLLGLRWLPKRVPIRGHARRRARGAAAAARDFAHGARRRAAAWPRSPMRR